MRIDPSISQMYDQMIHQSLKELMTKFLGDASYYQEKLGLLRSIFMPQDTADYFHYENYFEFENFDPTPLNSFSRALAGFLSYHISPQNRFFGVKFLEGAFKSLKDTERAKKMHHKIDDLHRIVQQHNNLEVYVKNYRDKLYFNFTGKVIEKDSFLTARFVYYPPEDLMLMSTDGQSNNVFGVRERLNTFQAKRRFPEATEEVVGDFTRGMFGGNDMMYCRFNVLRKDFYTHCMAKCGGYEDKVFEAYLKHLLGIKKRYDDKEDHEWVDFWMNDKGLLSLEVQSYRNIIISLMFPSNNKMGLGKGFGEMNIPTHVTLTELEEINLTAYEKTFDPFYVAHNESSLLGLDMSRGGVTLVENKDQLPQAVSLNADVRATIEYKNYYQARLDRGLFLDVFELINKSRMTRQEVDVRDTSSKRMLGPFVIQDTSDDLNPTIQAVSHIESESSKDSEVPSYLLNAYFTSPLAKAHKDMLFDDATRVLDVINKFGVVSESENEIHSLINLKAKLLTLLMDTEEVEWIEEVSKIVEKEKEVMAKKQIAMQKARAEALKASGDAIQGAQVNEQGNPGAGPQAGTEEATAPPGAIA